MVVRRDVNILKEKLKRDERDIRLAALDQLRSWGNEEISPEVGNALLGSAAERFPEVAGSYPSVPNEALVKVLWEHNESYEPMIAATLYPRLSDPAKRAILRMLASGSARAAAVLADTLKQIATGQTSISPQYEVLRPLRKSPRHCELLLPALVSLMRNPEWLNEAGTTVLTYVKKEKIDEAQRSGLAEILEGLMPSALEEATRTIAEADRDMRWSDPKYENLRFNCSLLLDLASRVNDVRLSEALQQAARSSDPWIATWGVIGLVRTGENPSETCVDFAAREVESRMTLLRELDALDKLDLVDDQWRTQPAIAEGDLVRWLSFPGELGRPPRELEHLETFVFDVNGGLCAMCLFKFRTEPPEDVGQTGWMVGVSGPHPIGDRPSLSSGSLTFSAYETVEDRSPREHLASLVAVVADWQEHHVEPDAKDGD